ncbi:MAG: ABC transporter permease subunit [Longilinea sp.]|nr:ABC transporter permease subunit [Longilinea sp.]MCA1955106.1 ABC transporter permease subunit [Anaerolinea sp.]
MPESKFSLKNIFRRKSGGGFVEQERRLPLGKQILLQLVCLFVAFTVLFPLMWVVSLSLDPRNIARPTEFRLIPPGASLDAYKRVLDQPTANPVKFWELARNQFFLASGTAIFSVLIGILAAYSFSRFEYPGRRGIMLGVVTVLMLPSIATMAPLFVLLNSINITIGDLSFNLRNSLFGVGIAIAAGQLPFAIWNLKGYLDTIPRELEEAARIDGASPNQLFVRIVLPLATPALAVTAFLAFNASWTEFGFSWLFLSNPKDFTLAMSLWNMVGQFSGDTPWSVFSAMALMVAMPVAIVYLMLQKYIVSGLTIGSVK